jgi:putative flavoprotein involved in K+ transport
MKTTDVIVIGGGQAGLAAGRALQKAGLDFVILEANHQAVGSWLAYYDSLKLFSPARHSALEGLPFSSDPNHYPSKLEVIEYLKAYAKQFQLPIVTNAVVTNVAHDDSGFQVFGSDFEYQSRVVINATGAFNQLFTPAVDGLELFTGRHLHSSSYKNPEPFKNQRVIVVGAGNSAIQIAVELAKVAQVSLATRVPVKFAPKRILGKDFHDWLKWIDKIPFGDLLPFGNSSLVWDSGEYQSALAKHQPDQRPMFQAFSQNGVIWSNGTTESVDAVIFATGFRPRFPYLEQTKAVNQNGEPIHRLGVSQSVPGLYYLGLSGQRSLASATLRGVSSDAKFIVTHAKKFLRPAKSVLQCCPKPLGI